MIARRLSLGLALLAGIVIGSLAQRGIAAQSTQKSFGVWQNNQLLVTIQVPEKMMVWFSQRPGADQATGSATLAPGSEVRMNRLDGTDGRVLTLQIAGPNVTLKPNN